MNTIFLCTIIALCLYSSQAQQVVKESVYVPAGWSLHGRADALKEVAITLAVKQRNTDLLAKKFWAVSDPQNSEYGKYLTHAEVKGLVSPAPESLIAVQKWLRENKIYDVEITNSGDFIHAKASVSQMEGLLDVPLVDYLHTESGRSITHVSKSYSVPADVSPHIDFIGGIMHFPSMKPRVIKAHHVEGVLATAINPTVARNFFNISNTVVGTNQNNSQAVAQFLEQYYSPKDLAAFQKKEKLDDQEVTKVVGDNNPNRPGIEADLDIEYIMGIAPKVPTWFVYTAGRYQTQEPFLDWVVNMSSDPSSPLVHSVSYGDDEPSVADDYKQRVDIEFQKYGVLGRSILFASGDDGTGCTKSCTSFVPNWPASSPYVTSVGGIYLDGTNPVADTIASGGFSNTFAQPPYQKDAVAAYLAAHTTPPKTFYNASGRAMPDIAAFSEAVQIVYEGFSTGVGGTSCASPMVGGVIALLNDARLTAKKPPMGFLNNFLYQTLAAHPDAFKDIIKGENANGCCRQGFQAAPGWDPITGVGVPNYTTLKAYALAAAK